MNFNFQGLTVPDLQEEDMEALLNLDQEDDIVDDDDDGGDKEASYQRSLGMMRMIRMTKRPALVEELGGIALWELGRTGGLGCSCAPDHHHD